ncbi:MAG: hypothetical protein QGM50_09200 [Anaerolineae bacterium]|nr:hypothetical protein [Anaerolineae bacterium]
MDESANEKAGTNNAGDSRQFNGQMGKTDICQVGGNVESFQLETGPLPIRTFMDDLLFIPGEWSHTWVWAQTGEITEIFKPLPNIFFTS